MTFHRDSDLEGEIRTAVTIDELPITPSAKSVRVALSRAWSTFDLNIAVLLLGLGTLSALKGLTLNVDETASYFYYTDYRFGFVVRGLVGQLFSPVLAMMPQSAHDDLLIAWHYATLTVLLVALSRLAARTVVATGRNELLAMAVLLFCSPLITSLANFTAAPDVLLCLLTMGVMAAIRAQCFVLAWLLFLVGILAHQLMIFIALPVMLLASSINTDRRSAVAGSILVGLAACPVILLTPAPDERLIGRFIEHGIAPDAARSLFDNQLGQTSARMLGVMAGMWRQNPLNGAIAVIYGASAGAVILAACLLSPGAIRSAAAPLTFLRPGRLRSILAALLVLGVGLSPLLVLAFALDLSRLAVLSTFTAFLTADTLLRRDSLRVHSPRSRLVTFICSTLAAIFLCLPFMGLWFTGALVKRQDLLIPDPILEIKATRTVVEGFLTFYNRNRP